MVLLTQVLRNDSYEDAITSKYFWEEAGMKIPEKIESVGSVSGTRLCHEHE
jgi:hypothetical protein